MFRVILIQQQILIVMILLPLTIVQFKLVVQILKHSITLIQVIRMELPVVMYTI